MRKNTHTCTCVRVCTHAHTEKVLCCILFKNLKLEASIAAQFCHLIIWPGRSYYIFPSLFPIYLSCKVVMGMDWGYIEIIPQKAAVFITEQDCMFTKGWTSSYQFTLSLLDTYYVPLPLHSDRYSFWFLDHIRLISVQSRQREVYDDALPCKVLGFGSIHCLLRLAWFEQTKIFEGQRHRLSLWQPWVGADVWESSWICEAQSSWWLISRGCSLL